MESTVSTLAGELKYFARQKGRLVRNSLAKKHMKSFQMHQISQDMFGVHILFLQLCTGAVRVT